MRSRSSSPDLSGTPPPAPDAPIAATVAQMTGATARPTPRPIPWTFLSLVGRGGGVLLLFVGTLVLVIGGGYPAGCFTSTCGGGVFSGVEYAILTARILWAIGAFGLSAGAGIELHFVLHSPRSDSSEEHERFLAQRRAAFVLLLVGVGILVVLLVTEPLAVATA